MKETDTTLKRAFDTVAQDLLAADAIIFGTPENFGYMSGAVFNVERICTGLKLNKVFEPVIAVNVNTLEILAKGEEMGATLAAGIAFGIF